MTWLTELWHSMSRARALALALLMAVVGVALSAAFPQDAEAFPILPIIVGGAAALGVFGGAAGDLVVQGVQAILDWIYGGLKDTITPFVMEFLTRVDLVFDGGLERMVVPLVVIGADDDARRNLVGDPGLRRRDRWDGERRERDERRADARRGPGAVDGRLAHRRADRRRRGQRVQLLRAT
ncbi:MAG TPA: hypothetical protein VMY78_09125 [Solirubrobacteraceae bacterium]|nr:hypothetical protein [Solirubrobacteraceae bacterium]